MGEIEQMKKEAEELKKQIEVMLLGAKGKLTIFSSSLLLLAGAVFSPIPLEELLG